MFSHQIIKSLSIKTDSKIVLLIMDGLGGLPDPETNLTELEAAYTPNMDKIAKDANLGQIIPISPGITPGSGPAHLSLFGYDPVANVVGRGVLAALGIGFPLEKKDVAARINFCTVDGEGVVTDRRAGRISNEKNRQLVKKIQEQVKVAGVELFFKTVKEHRAVMVIRAEGLSGAINDTDPQQVGRKPYPCKPTDDTPEARKTANIVEGIVSQVKQVLKDEHPANMILLRGFASIPDIESMEEIYKLKCAAIAVYPMYRGLAKLVGMDVLPAPKDEEGEFEQLEEVYDDYDFFFIHIKGTDSSGEDGDYDRKKKVIEKVDSLLPRLLKLKPDVLAITGDHSTPSQLKSHSWHPVPVLIYSKNGRRDRTESFGERECAHGLLGTFYATDLLPLMMAKALKLNKFGA